MIKRYSKEEMEKIWELESKFDYYLKVELAVCESYFELGKIPSDSLQNILKNAKFDLNRIDELEKELKHDVLAFLTSVNESLGEDAKYVHIGLTSSDVIDTAFALQIKDATDLIELKLINVIETLKLQAVRYKHMPCVGRSHGIHAEPTTFGLKLLNFLTQFERCEKRLQNVKKEISVGQISGPVGTYSNVSMEIESLTCKRLGLEPAKTSTQVISRDIHANYMQTLALIAAAIEQVSVEIRHLQRTEVNEVQEAFTTGQKGSSAMPHKMNPVSSENLSGLARVIRANALAALENIALWHERDISHSSVERIIFPDSTILIHYMLDRFNGVISNLIVHEDNMLKNLNFRGGLVFSQALLLKLTEKGLPRDSAYYVVQRNAFKAFSNPDGDFKFNVLNDEEVKKYLSNSEIESCFDLNRYLANVDKIFERVI